MIAAFAQTKAILEIMTTVYANSKNIPQGVKDLVNLKYADVLKLVGDEDKLKEIVEPARRSLRQRRARRGGVRLCKEQRKGRYAKSPRLFSM